MFIYFSLAPSHGIPSFDLPEFNGVSQEALDAARSLSRLPSVDPSTSSLQAHIADLEADLRNIDFRLQNFYHQRIALATLLTDAQARLPAS